MCATHGAFDNFAGDNDFKTALGGSFGDISFGNVLPVGLSEDQIAADLSAVGSLQGGGDLGEVDLVYFIPAPKSLGSLVFGLTGILCSRRHETRRKLS